MGKENSNDLICIYNSFVKSHVSDATERFGTSFLNDLPCSTAWAAGKITASVMGPKNDLAHSLAFINSGLHTQHSSGSQHKVDKCSKVDNLGFFCITKLSGQ